MEMIMMVMAEDVDPGLVLRKLTSVASGLAPEPEMRRRERERRCLRVSQAGPAWCGHFPHWITHCLTLSCNGDNLPPPPSALTLTLPSLSTYSNKQ